MSRAAAGPQDVLRAVSMKGCAQPEEIAAACGADVVEVEAVLAELGASPRVDSYHTVWFELHEDLIRLAGLDRSDEAAAGRA